MRTHDGNLALVLGDEQGSVSVTMPVTLNPDGTMASATVADAQAVTVTSYTPYGQLRGADNLALDRGWLGQVEDRADATTGTGTGLTYLNARYYDPVLARFITPDPLMNPANPTTLDPYRYADNNPVVFTDASGLAPNKISDDDANRQAAPTVAKKTAAVVAVKKATGQMPSSANPGGGKKPRVAPQPNGDDSYRPTMDGRIYRDGQFDCVAGAYQCVQENIDANPDPAPLVTVEEAWGWLKGGSREIWQGARFAKVAIGDPISAALTGTMLIGSTLGVGSCGFSTREAMYVCAGAPSWTHARGGTMLGAVFVTGNQDRPDDNSNDLHKVLADEQLLAHEAKHMDQVAIMGELAFAPAYFLSSAAEATLGVITGQSHPSSCNIFERWAGFEDGGYHSCAG